MTADVIAVVAWRQDVDDAVENVGPREATADARLEHLVIGVELLPNGRLFLLTS